MPDDDPDSTGDANATYPNVTITRYDQLAAEILTAIEELEARFPDLEARPMTADAIRSHQNVPRKFLSTAVHGAEGWQELQTHLDVARGYDTLQFGDAFRGVRDRLQMLLDRLQFTLSSRRALLASEALNLYAVARALRRTPSGVSMGHLVQDLHRDLGRRGRPKKKRVTAPPEADAQAD